MIRHEVIIEGILQGSLKINEAVWGINGMCTAPLLVIFRETYKCISFFCFLII